MTKKSIASILLLGVVVLAMASSGGGNNKKKASLNTNFCTSAHNGFTLKSGPQYTGSLAFTKKTKEFVLHNSVMAYQKGNTIYILPYKYKLSNEPVLRSNLQVVDLKFRLHK